MRLVAQALFRRGNLIRLTAPHGRALTSMIPLASETTVMTVSSQKSFPRSSLAMIRSLSTESQNNLVDILSREEQEEMESGNLEMPDELAELKQKLEKHWRIVDDGAVTQLFLKDKKVQISFHCQDTVEEQAAYEEEEEEVDEEPIAPVRFTVTLSKAGKSIAFGCLSELGETTIESVATTKSAPDAIHANQGALDKSEFQGPEFSELAEDLQEAIAVFLEDGCDVSSDVAAFVAMYTDYKEQLQYVEFLKDARSIIS